MAIAERNATTSDEDTDEGHHTEEGGLDTYAGDGRLSELEAYVLDEYVRLRRNLDKLAAQLEELSALPSVGVSETLRLLERKTALVHTALKSSVYSIVLSAQEEGG